MSELSNEFKVMAEIVAILEKVDTETRGRVINWAADKFDVATRASSPVEDSVETKSATSNVNFTEFVDLYDAVDPSNQIEKALTGAYWFQVIKTEASWQAQHVNSILKDTGNGIAGIAHVLEGAQAKKPALVRQIVKSGKTRQARKTYKLTSTGIKLIADHLQQPSSTVKEVE